MPARYTHYLIANKCFHAFPEEVKSEISDLALYFFGAQGADFCFFYKFYNPQTPNFGSFLHRKGGYDAFSVLLLFARRYPQIRSYALGFISHYAVDCAFHPDVYALSGKSPVKHNRIEYALDEYFKGKEGYDELSHYIKGNLNEKQKRELFFAYSAISAKCGFPPLQYPAFCRAISLFNGYSPITNAVLGNKPSVENPLENADELFVKAIEKTQTLTAYFLDALSHNHALSKPVFSKSYLTGK